MLSEKFRRVLSSLAVGMFVVGLTAVPVSAQTPRQDAYREYIAAQVAATYWREYYEQYSQYGDRFRQLPEAMVRCHHQECLGMVGTYHVDEGQMHFRPYDETNRRMGTIAGGAAGATGGAILGGVLGGWKGAGAGGVSGAALGGVLASRNAHDNCLVVKTEVVPQPAGQQVPVQQPAQRQESRAQVYEPKFEVRNPGPVDAVVFYDGNPSETWVARRKSSVRIPRRDGTLQASIAMTTADGNFEDYIVTPRGDGRKFVIYPPER